MIKILLIICCFYFSGCSILQPNPYSPDGEKEITIFTDLLSSGWDIEVHENKIILIKYDSNKFLLNDVFNLME